MATRIWCACGCGVRPFLRSRRTTVLSGARIPCARLESMLWDPAARRARLVSWLPLRASMCFHMACTRCVVDMHGIGVGTCVHICILMLAFEFTRGIACVRECACVSSMMNKFHSAHPYVHTYTLKYRACRNRAMMRLNFQNQSTPTLTCTSLLAKKAVQ